jgi:putative PIN family toxin of toxin-antitoxin system
VLRAVLDTNILVAALRSPKGASSALLTRLAQRRFVLLGSVPLFLEYEAVLSRPDQLAAFGLTQVQVDVILDYLANVMQEVRMHYLWRPQLNDVADEMVLDTAINGRADVLVTFNGRHFSPAPNFGIEVLQPRDALRRLS